MDAGIAWRAETRTGTSTAFLYIAAVLAVVGIAAPFLLPRAVTDQLFLMLTMLVLAQNWNLLAGYAGLVSVGQQVFVGLGAYAMFAAVALAGLDPILAIPIGGIAAAILAVPIAFFIFRLQGAYFAIGTWVIAEVARLVLAQWKALGGGTGASLPHGAVNHMAGVDLVRSLSDARPAEAAGILAYWLALLLAVATIGFIYRFLRSSPGLGLSAIRDNQETARAVGVDAKRMRLIVYLAVSFMTGLTGALIYVQKARISPEAAFSINDWTAYVIFIAVIGGVGTLEGPIIGVVVFYLLQALFADFGSWYLLALGAISVAVMIFAPAGIWGVVSRRTGIELFPIRRRLTGGSITMKNGGKR